MGQSEERIGADGSARFPAVSGGCRPKKSGDKTTSSAPLQPISAEPIRATTYTHAVTLRYGRLAQFEVFRTELAEMEYNQQVVVQTRRGLEIGYVRKGPVPIDTVPETEIAGTVVRIAMRCDRERWQEMLNQSTDPQFKSCRGHVRRLNLPMKLVGVETIFGGDKLIFYFTAEGRIDFRQLVKDLARDWRTRIEMRQIGARDEARLLGDIGPCGQQLCCSRHIWAFEPVSMKMAKNQGTTLDPTKLSGACGRLKCCLRYENETYSVLKQTVPATGAIAVVQNSPSPDTASTGYTTLKVGTEVRVISQNVLTQRVLVESTADDGREWLNVADIEWDHADNLHNNDFTARRGRKRH